MMVSSNARYDDHEARLAYKSDELRQRIVGVIPAAGLGKRLRPYNGFKELLPIGYHVHKDSSTKLIIPRVVSEYTLSALQEAEVKNVLFVISPQKAELFRFFGSGERFGMNVGYLCQDEPTGMPGAIDVAYAWVKDYVVLMGMPDTIIFPGDCFSQLLDFHWQTHSHLSLGIFPTQNPHSLAPVRIDDTTGRVLDMFDKPANPPCFNTWGIAVWGPEFTKVLHDFVQVHKDSGSTSELILTDVFRQALHVGLDVFGKIFPDGEYCDIGTPEGLLRAKLYFEYPQIQNNLKL